MRVFILRVILPVLIFIFGVLSASVFYLPQKVQAQACTTPAQVPNVQVTYPSCVGNQCNFSQAGCAWGTVADAVKYHVKITQIETSTVAYDQQVDSSTTNVSATITPNNTYKCDVSAINSCGNEGPAGTHQLFCQQNAGITTAPTAAVTPGSTTAPTTAPVLKPGSTTTSIAIGSFSLIIVMLGGILFLL